MLRFHAEIPSSKQIGRRRFGRLAKGYDLQRKSIESHGGDFSMEETKKFNKLALTQQALRNLTAEGIKGNPEIKTTIKSQCITLCFPAAGVN